jgi:hypothetical protein
MLLCVLQSFQERLAEQRAERESNPDSQKEFKGQRSKEESTEKRKAVRMLMPVQCLSATLSRTRTRLAFVNATRRCSAIVAF